jgi:hypothetical protein
MAKKNNEINVSIIIQGVTLVVLVGLVFVIYNMNDRMNDRFSNMNDRMNDRFSNMNDRLSSVVDNLNDLRRYTIGVHDFGAERLSFSGKITRKFVRDNQQGTMFSACAGGYCGWVTVSHYNFSGKTPEDMIACDDVDIAITTTCPDIGDAVNLSRTAPLRPGDIVVAHGFSDNAVRTSWTGHIMGNRYGEMNDGFSRSAPHFSGEANIPVDALIVDGNQLNGMSGALVLNGYGAVGVANAISQLHKQSTIVIPLSHVTSCMIENGKRGHLKRQSSCENLVVVDPPVLGEASQFLQDSCHIPGSTLITLELKE